jgi:electron transport complex protein RnfE
MHRTIMIQKLFNNKNQTGLLALAPFFLVACSFNNGVIIGLTSLFMIIILTTILYLISNCIPSSHSLVSVIIVSATVVLVARMILNSEMYFVAETIGLFLPLLVINSLVISLGEEVFSKQDHKSTVLYIFSVAIAVFIFFILFGFLKGLLDVFAIIKSPAGNFILAGLLFATINFFKSNEVVE